MEMPPVHLCVFLNREHELLKSKIDSLKDEISQLKRTEAEHRTCSISIQTETRRPAPPPSPPPAASSREEEIRLRRLIEAQNDLLKKYEEDFRAPPPHLIDDYRRQLKRYEEEKDRAVQRCHHFEHRREKCQKRFDQLKDKLSVFDRGFFEEVNDLKYALQQAIHLNREYEKTIEMLSSQLGIEYPISDA